MVVCLIAQSTLILLVIRRSNEHPMLVTIDAARRPVLIRVDILDLDVFEQLVVAHMPLVRKAHLELRQIFPVLKRSKLHAFQFQSVLHKLDDKLALFFLINKTTQVIVTFIF